jgi:nucleotide-binding universal stress UspA family protein
MEALMARLTGRSIDLLLFDEVRHKLQTTRIAERGLQDIPLAAIVGTVGRYADFTRTFLPRTNTDVERWSNVKIVTESAQSGGLPPIEVYQMGEAYFVRDGHHRVSVARQLGADSISAYVTEVHTRVPLSPEDRPEALIWKAEYADFLSVTRLDELRPGADLSVSEPGQYARLAEHIELHGYVLEAERGPDAPYEAAVTDWYDNAYRPVVELIRERGMLRDFPGRTETDLYLWIVEHREELRHELGWNVKPESVIGALAENFSPRPNRQLARWGRRVLEATTLAGGPAPGVWRKERLEARYVDRLFTDLLVPVSGEPGGWLALDQALEVARRERGQLLGLHVSAGEAGADDAALAVKDEFERRCETAGVPGRLAIDTGDVARRICERAALADLVIVHLARPMGTQPLTRLGSGFRALLRRCPRPVLIVPRRAAPMQKMLLAYDGSAKAREALFVAAYLAEEWKSALTVLTVAEGDLPSTETLDFARKYLEFHEVQADFIEARGPVPSAMLTATETEGCDVILMGGYGAHPMVEAVLGSSVDQILRAASLPVLVCR